MRHKHSKNDIQEIQVLTEALTSQAIISATYK